MTEMMPEPLYPSHARHAPPAACLPSLLKAMGFSERKTLVPRGSMLELVGLEDTIHVYGAGRPEAPAGDDRFDVSFLSHSNPDFIPTFQRNLSADDALWLVKCILRLPETQPRGAPVELEPA